MTSISEHTLSFSRATARMPLESVRVVGHMLATCSCEVDEDREISVCRSSPCRFRTTKQTSTVRAPRLGAAFLFQNNRIPLLGDRWDSSGNLENHAVPVCRT